MTQLPDVVSENTPVTSPSRPMEDNTVCIYSMYMFQPFIDHCTLHRMYILTLPYQQPIVFQNNYKIIIIIYHIYNYNRFKLYRNILKYYYGTCYIIMFLHGMCEPLTECFQTFRYMIIVFSYMIRNTTGTCSF